MEKTLSRDGAAQEGTDAPNDGAAPSSGASSLPAGDAPSLAAIQANAAAQDQVAATGGKLSKIEAVIHKWFQDHVHNSPVAYEERAWNHMVEAKQKLIEMVKGL